MVSKKTKELVREFHILKNIRPRLAFYDSIGYIVALSSVGSFYLFKNENIAEYAELDIKFSAPHFDAKSWLKHFLYIFHVSEINTIAFNLSDGRFDYLRLPMVQECLNNLNISNLSIDFTTQIPLMMKLISVFPPNIKLRLRQTFPEPLEPSRLFELRDCLN